MSKYTRIRSYSPSKATQPIKKSPVKRTSGVAKPIAKPVKDHGPVGNFFVNRWRWFKRLSKPKKALVIATPLLAFLILTPIFTYLYYANAISDPDRLMNYNNAGVVLLDSDGKPFYSFGTANRGERLPLDQISDYTEKALISSEDKNFYKHGGFSLFSILGALYANILSGDATAYGGSTLTQQLAKNTLLSKNQTFLRKYQELTVSLAIEQRYSKDEILDLYLNSVYYGEGAFGIGNAAKTYFGKSAADLDLAESAMLVGVLPAPSAYSPVSGNPAYAKERQGTVLGRMVDNKVITQTESDAAKAEVLAYAPQSEGQNGTAPHFAEMVLNELYKKYGEERVTRSGFRVTTTLDLALQKAANETVSKQISFIQRNGGSNAAVVAIDPATGEIRALVGSADYNNEDFGKVNMAITPRQPGSSIKPLYYTEAMRRDLITPATILKDEPTDFGGGYRPLNADRRFRGNVTVRNALAQSLNIPSVEVMQKLGVANTVDTLRQLGISTIDSSKDYGLSLALGSAEAKLTEMTNAYAAFANSGKQYETTSVTEIKDKFEKQIFRNTTKTPKQVMDADSTFLISNILDDESARAPVFGSSLNTNGYSVAVKTGTTDEARDAWTIGYAKQLTVGVWVGNNNNTPMNNGGSGMAGPIWRSVMMAGLKGQSNQPFTAPSGVQRILICKSNGLRAIGGGTDGTYQEYFKSGTAPSKTCDVPKPPEDSDKDGVNDDRDKCPNTPAGTKVDENGCPVKTDDEGGTNPPDTSDKCQNVPPDVEVDQNGCPVSNNGNGTGPSPVNPVTPPRRN
ncbi:PBP1A family penicillin-binding protein [Candidatus Saccharibacteria bacterium TM7i]|nr:PBP1A family penicillin-binding protein [Candidatus Saccharibacteria bacterium TM7i]